MADSRRWTAGTGVRRDDQFTRAPAFRDGLDSPPLSERSSWHGSGGTQVALAVGLAVVAAVGAVAFMLLSPDASGPGALSSGSAAQGDGSPAGNGVQVPGAAGNATTSPPPLPSPLPSLPAPALP